MSPNSYEPAGRSVADLNIALDLNGDFYGAALNLTSLEGSPTSINGVFNCSNNRLTSLKYAPYSVRSDFYAYRNLLTSLEYAPVSVGHMFDCDSNRLTSLEGIHKQIKHMRVFTAVGNSIQSNVLGLLLVKGLQKVYLDDKKVMDILNSHLPSSGMHDVLAAQDELVNAGFDDFAHL